MAGREIASEHLPAPATFEADHEIPLNRFADKLGKIAAKRRERIKMRLLRRDANKPGRPILFAGIAAGAVMGTIGLVWTAFDPTGIGPIILGMIVIVPATLSLLTLFLAWVFFLQSGITGPPSSDFLMSVAYFLSPIKRSWRGIVGASLIVGSLAGTAHILRWVCQQ
jgi:hypothetical protein